MEIVRTKGGRLVKSDTVFYNLDAVISVGYRVNSVRATQFRQCRSQYNDTAELRKVATTE